MTADARPAFLDDLWVGLDGPPIDSDLELTGDGALPSVFAVADVAAASVAAAGLAAAEFIGVHHDTVPAVRVDRRLASLWFRWSMAPVGWELPSVWDSVAGNYRCDEGWIRLHTNAPHHRAAALAVLGVADDEASVGPEEMRQRTAASVGRWSKADLEAAVVAAQGCAAAMWSHDEWAVSTPGRAVAGEPLVAWTRHASAVDPVGGVLRHRPLEGVRVLDLTRVLAGPVATRFLAGLGADVLRIDPPDWDEPAVLADVTLGKRRAHLDLTTAADRDRLRRLLADADVIVHGYRDGALRAKGFDDADRRTIRPGLVDVSLNAYGWTGPWKERRGFDSLVQMSSGIAHAGMDQLGKDTPFPLPVQALDHAAGYLLAAAALRGLTRRNRCEGGSTAKVSLARMAALLTSGPPGDPSSEMAPVAEDDYQTEIEATSWGDAKRLRPPVALDGCTLAWRHPAGTLGTSDAAWLDR